MTTPDAGSAAIVVAGDALVDLTPVTTASGTVAYEPHAGGSCLNVAVGLGRLEVPTAFLGRISSDAFGALLRAHLADSGVLLGYIVPTEDLTTLAFVHLREGQATYSFHATETADRGLLPAHLTQLAGGGALPPAAALHVGSIALVLEPVATTLDGLIHQESRRRLISLDPNVRPNLIADRETYLSRFESWIELVDIVKVSAEDLAWLYPEAAEDDVIDRWLNAGVALVAVTAGGAGARARTRAASVEVPGPVVSVVDTVGAGDAFMAGMLAHLYAHSALDREAVAAFDPEPLAAMVEAACFVAGDTCTRPGADPPRRSSLMREIPAEANQATVLGGHRG